MIRRQEVARMEKLKFCLAGVGSIGRRHLRLLGERDDVTLCVAEPSDASWARASEKSKGVMRYLSLEEALAAEGPDAVVIATPHGMHAGMALEALSAGAHVFCEKPMSDSLEECVAMLRAAEACGKVFSVGFMFRFDPFIKKVKALIDSGRIGQIVHYSSRFATYNTLLCSVTRHQANTPFSIVMDCIHDTDLLCHLTGRVPDHVFASAIHAGELPLSSPQNVIDTIYRWNSGDLAAFTHFNYVEHPQVHTLEITGDKGYIQGDFMTAAITVGSIDGTIEQLSAPRIFDDVYRAEWDHFIRAVRGEVPAENPARSAILPTLLMQGQKESVAEGQEVDLHEIAARYGFHY